MCANLRRFPMRKQAHLLILLCLILTGCAKPKSIFPNGQVIDLSHPFDAQTVYWPTEQGFVLEKEQAGLTDQGYYYASNKFSAPEHGGTHIDAPRHFAANGNTLDQVPLTQLMGEAVLLDVTKQCEANHDYLVSVDDFNAWEKQHGQIPMGAIVILRTGFAKYWPDRNKYMGTDERGAAAVAKLPLPGLSPEAAKWLVANRSVKAIGLDTPSI